ncbi:MAG: alpha-amylase, partial [Betaproteobacteria bacterium]
VAGALEHVSTDGTVTALALLQAYVVHSGDGWVWAIEYLERFLEGQRMRTEPPTPDVHDGFASLVQTLGTRTAQLHQALSLRTGNREFDPEIFSQSDLDAWKGRLREELRATLDVLETLRQELSAVAPRTQDLLDASSRMLAMIEEAALPSPPPEKIRTHGDYHLGQVLVVKNDFTIIDFEGEPGRTMAERRTKRLAVRDVAGMLRSFDYARSTAVRHVAQDDGEQLSALEALGASWLEQMRHTFLAAYAACLQDHPAQFEGQRSLLALAELEKALYEIRYEAANRPAWVGIPVEGALALIERP